MSTLTRRRLLQSGLAAAATVSFGSRSGARHSPRTPPGTAPTARSGRLTRTGSGSRRASLTRDRAVRSGRAQHGLRVPDRARWPGDVPDAGRRLDPGGQHRDADDRWACPRSGSTPPARSPPPTASSSNTHVNCAGGPTPWGTWLSCEEIAAGRVWECDPTGGAPVVRPLLGVFPHEAVLHRPEAAQHVYLSEDFNGGCLYRFLPDVYPDCRRRAARGRLRRRRRRARDLEDRCPTRTASPARAVARARSRRLPLRARGRHLVRRRARVSGDDRGRDDPRLRHRGLGSEHPLSRRGRARHAAEAASTTCTPRARATCSSPRTPTPAIPTPWTSASSRPRGRSHAS